MRVPVEEREITIGGYIYNDDDDHTRRDYFEVFTSDYGYMAKLDKMCEQYPEHWRHREQQPEWRQGGDIVGKFYECSVGCVFLRGKPRAGTPQTEEQKQAFRERMIKAREQGKI